MIICAGLMFIVSFLLSDVAWTYYLILFLIGITLCGPFNLVRSAITIDLGKQMKGNNITSVAALI